MHLEFSIVEAQHLVDSLRHQRAEAIYQADNHETISDDTRARFWRYASELETLRERIIAAVASAA